MPTGWAQRARFTGWNQRGIDDQTDHELCGVGVVSGRSHVGAGNSAGRFGGSHVAGSKHASERPFGNDAVHHAFGLPIDADEPNPGADDCDRFDGSDHLHIEGTQDRQSHRDEH